MHEERHGPVATELAYLRQSRTKLIAKLSSVMVSAVLYDHLSPPTQWSFRIFQEEQVVTRYTG